MRLEDTNIKVLTFPEEMISLLESLSTKTHILEVQRDFDNKPIISVNVLNNAKWDFTQIFTLDGETKPIIDWFLEISYVYDDGSDDEIDIE